MVGKRARKAEASGDADYDAVRRACSKAPPAEGGDLGAKLDDALKSGWSIEALKAYAFSAWRDPAVTMSLTLHGACPLSSLTAMAVAVAAIS